MDNYMWNQILDLPVIVQGALGSFLFWLVFEILRRFFNYLLTLISRFNKNVKKEVLMYEALHHAHNAYGLGSGEQISFSVASIYASLNRFIKAVIYICLALVSSHC